MEMIFAQPKFKELVEAANAARQINSNSGRCFKLPADLVRSEQT